MPLLCFFRPFLPQSPSIDYTCSTEERKKGGTVMSNPQAGWYADPQGDPTRLRYWNGVQWTDDYMAAQNAVPVGAQQAPVQPEAQPYSQQTAQPMGQQPGAQAFTAQAQPQYQTQPSFQQGVSGNPQSVTYVNVQQPTMVPGQPVCYPVSETDRTLRLIAFIWDILCLVSVCWLLIPLAWMIPMTVHTYGIYKGTKPNTTGFGVCTLLFLGVISGILLLCSKKDA